jgi:hypothetical protein
MTAIMLLAALAALGSGSFSVTSAIRGQERMHKPPDPSRTQIPVPLGQRLFDNVFLLLGAGLIVMFVLYTGWGLWEILSLPTSRLP